MTKELTLRLLVGPVLAGGAVGAFVGDYLLQTHFFLAGMVILCAICGCVEFGSLAITAKAHLQRSSLLFFAVLTAATPLILHYDNGGFFDGWPLATLTLSLALIVFCFRHVLKHGYTDVYHHVGANCFGLLYLGIIPSFMIELCLLGSTGGSAGLMQGSAFFILSIGACKLGDVFAFTGGKLFGRHKMAPSVSPGKTWEGFVASLFGSIGGSYLIGFLFSLTVIGDPFSHWWGPLLWGAVLGPIGVFGDLIESMMKRTSGVKDSGKTIPGFGGFLDVFDAVILVAPAAYVLAHVV